MLSPSHGGFEWCDRASPQYDSVVFRGGTFIGGSAIASGGAGAGRARWCVGRSRSVLPRRSLRNRSARRSAALQAQPRGSALATTSRSSAINFEFVYKFPDEPRLDALRRRRTRRSTSTRSTTATIAKPSRASTCSSARKRRAGCSSRSSRRHRFAGSEVRRGLDVQIGLVATKGVGHRALRPSPSTHALRYAQCPDAQRPS